MLRKSIFCAVLFIAVGILISDVYGQPKSRDNPLISRGGQTDDDDNDNDNDGSKVKKERNFGPKGSTEDFFEKLGSKLEEKAKSTLKELEDKIPDIARLGSSGVERMVEKLKNKPQEVRDAVVNLTRGDDGAVDEDAIEEAGCGVITTMVPEDNLRKLAGKFPSSARAKFCQSCTDEDEEISSNGVEKLLRSGIDCSAEFKQKLKKKMKRMESRMRIIAKDILKKKNPSGYDDDDVEIMTEVPDSVEDDMIENMNILTFNKNVGKLMTSMPPAVRKKVVNKFMSTKEELKVWGKETLGQAAQNGVLEELDEDELEEIPESTLIEGAKDICGKVKNKATEKQLRRRLNKNKDNLNLTDVEGLKKTLPCLEPDTVKDLIPVVLYEALDENTDLDDDEVTEIAKKFKELDLFKAKFSAQDTKKMRNVLNGFSPKDLKEKLDANVVLQELTSLKSVKLSPSNKRVMVEKYREAKGKDKKMSENDLNDLGPLSTGLTPEELDEIDIESCSTDLPEELFEDERSSTMLLDKCRNGKGKKEKMLKIPGFAKRLSTDDINEMDDDTLISMSENDTTAMKVPKKVGKTVLEKLQKKLGKVGSWPLEKIRSLQPFLNGINADDFKDFEMDGQLLDKLEEFKEYIDDLDPETGDEAAKKIKEFFMMDDKASVPESEFGEVEADQVGRFCPFLKLPDIDKLEKNISARVMQRCGKNKFKKVRKDICEKWAEKYLKYVERDDVVEDRSQASTIDNRDLINMGGFKQCLKRTIFQKFTKEALEDYTEDLQELLDLESRKQVADEVKSKISDFVNKREWLVKLGSLLGQLSQNDLNTIDKEELRSVISDIADSFFELNVMIKERDDEGYTNELSAEDREKLKEAQEKAADLMGKSLEENTNRRRRRRSTTPLTCSDVKTMKDMVTSIPDISAVSGMDNTEFGACLEHLGNKTWKSEHLSALASKVKVVLGSAVQDWSSEQVRQVGSMAAGLTAEELGKLVYDQSAIYSLGKHALYTSEKLAYGFLKWLSDTQSGQVAGISAAELQYLGEFACGLTASHISGLSQTAYSNAASAVGEIKSCNSEQKTAYAKKATASWGTVSTWSVTRLEDIGHMISGLTDNELSSLSASQFKSIKPSVIMEIPKDKFKMFSKDALSNMLSTQANAVTQEQFNELSEDKQSVLNNKRTTKFDISAGCTLTSMNLLIALLTAVTILFNRY